MILPRPIGYVLSVIVLASCVSCSGVDPASPTTPSATPSRSTGATQAAPAAAGATINGSVTSARTLGPSSAVSALTIAGLTVTVVGSNVTSSVDNAGRFVLNNVPPGDIHLRFTGNGVDANVAISAVRNGDQINIAVTISGNGATLDRMTRPGDQENDDNDRDEDENEIELEGTISAGTCASFALNGTTITTNTSTVFRTGSCADIKAGAKVEVKGVRNGSGVLATRIDVKGLENNEVEIEGRVTAATGCTSFTVNGTVIMTNAATQFRDGSCADIKPNVKVEVKGTRTGANTVLATRVEIDK